MYDVKTSTATVSTFKTTVKQIQVKSRFQWLKGIQTLSVLAVSLETNVLDSHQTNSDGFNESKTLCSTCTVSEKLTSRWHTSLSGSQSVLLSLRESSAGLVVCNGMPDNLKQSELSLSYSSAPV